MSAGRFEDAKYEQRGGANIWACRAQPESKGLTIAGTANAYPADAVTPGLFAIKLRKSRREAGLPIRTVTVELTADGSGATSEYKSGTLHTVPVFTEAAYEDYPKGATGTYLGIACRVAGRTLGE